MGSPILIASSAVVMMCMAAPQDSTKPPRVEVNGRDASDGRLPAVTSSVESFVAFMLANSKDPSSVKSSVPPVIMTCALPLRMVSTPSSTDRPAVAHAAAHGLTGPAELTSSMLSHAAGVLTKVSWRASPFTSFSSHRSLKMSLRDAWPPMPLPRDVPTSLMPTCSYNSYGSSRPALVSASANATHAHCVTRSTRVLRSLGKPKDTGSNPLGS
mmetsp:Transcript_28463/g.81998  ORF Transcript_28463/g.81998 Transcript_28463/m.81998 type:complete len:213 (+) Transcript_28463:2139-2777(+)